GDGWGYGGNIGVLCKVNSEWTCGLSYRSETSVKLSGETKVDAYAPIVGVIRSEISSSSTKMTLPANLGFGIVYRPEEKLIVSADVDWTEWSSYDRFVITNDTPGGLITSTSMCVNDWKNTIRYSLGLHYKIDNNFNIYTGYYIDPSPIPDKTLTPWVPDCGTKQGFDLSLGYTVKTAEFICGYEYMSASSRTVTGAPQDVDGDGVVDNLPGNYTLKSGNVRLGMNILF
ncbi:MAG: outer membrane protein transport protein, partial [bacterium]